MNKAVIKIVKWLNAPSRRTHKVFRKELAEAKQAKWNELIELAQSILPERMEMENYVCGGIHGLSIPTDTTSSHLGLPKRIHKRPKVYRYGKSEIVAQPLLDRIPRKI